MFNALDDKDRDIVIKAMEERKFKFTKIINLFFLILFFFINIEKVIMLLNKEKMEIFCFW